MSTILSKKTENEIFKSEPELKVKNAHKGGGQSFNNNSDNTIDSLCHEMTFNLPVLEKSEHEKSNEEKVNEKITKYEINEKEENDID